MRAKSKTDKHRRRHPSMPARNAAFHGLYAARFSRQERASLASLIDTDSLDGEITLLRILIRRRLARPPGDQMQDGGATLSVDVDKIARYVDSLCRAIKTRRLAGDNTRQEMDRALHEALTEIENELHLSGASANSVAIPLAASSGRGFRAHVGVGADGPVRPGVGEGKLIADS